MIDQGSANYLDLRRRHFRVTLRDLVRNQVKALWVIALIVGPMWVGLLWLLAQAVSVLGDPRSSMALRLSALTTWVIASSLIVLVLREAIFMKAAQHFLRTLPIAAGVRLFADLRAIALACSPLVIPFSYYWGHLAGRAQDRPFAIVSTVGCLVLAVLTCAAGAHPTRRAALAISGAIAAYVFAPLLPVPAIATVGGSLALGWLGVVFAYREPATSAHRPLSAAETSLANQSGWALPVLYRDLRYAALLRVLGIALGVSFVRLIAGQSPDCEKMGLLVEVQLAIAVLMLYQLPALIQRRLNESVPFLYRLRRMRVRVAAAGRAISVMAFGAAAAVIVAWGANACGMGMWVSHRTWLAVTSFSCLLMALSVMASHLRGITWIAVAASLALSVVLAQIA